LICFAELEDFQASKIFLIIERHFGAIIQVREHLHRVGRGFNNRRESGSQELGLIGLGLKGKGVRFFRQKRIRQKERRAHEEKHDQRGAKKEL
jgi:hypothetical protein